ncbi:hypothetical protein R8Z57_17330 [Microbacterium sp. M3]|uniref:Uncharacterized protein n=1 Tax=Microbacterium arthrosphaerae TaxID=792652 RepID=A0ABU4H5D5_9MICO|nr:MULTISPECIES: hypothetical protein [Microbacterium]MDW4574541.1 hypothetical protein [Microbacterium arthrosphaerae]MDW7608396.1 hypothetical protein [Microbacterium sp. M3]
MIRRRAAAREASERAAAEAAAEAEAAAFEARLREIDRENRAGRTTALVVGGIAAVFAATLAVVSWLAVPGDITLALPTRGVRGPADLGEIPALAAAIVNTALTGVAVGWLIFSALVWPERRLARILIPIVAYSVGVGVIYGLIIASGDSERIALATFGYFFAGLGVVVFAIGLAPKPAKKPKARGVRRR